MSYAVIAWGTANEARTDVDRIIDARILVAVAYERHRDASPYESPRYWMHHDTAMKWHAMAESLMPTQPARQ